MQNRIWDDYIPQKERDFYKQAGFGGVSGFGQRCALLVIDVQNRTVGSKPMPVEEAVKEYPMSCGEYGWKALPNIKKLVECFRANDMPVFYPYVAFKNKYDQGQFGTKVSAVMQIPESGYDIHEMVSPREGDIPIAKYHPSAFFGTSLCSYLIEKQIDTLVVTGATTSGCVRGTVVDASSYNFKVVVAEDAVFDRVQASHAVNLFDMANKYADVLNTDQIVHEVKKLKLVA